MKSVHRHIFIDGHPAHSDACMLTVPHAALREDAEQCTVTDDVARIPEGAPEVTRLSARLPRPSESPYQDSRSGHDPEMKGIFNPKRRFEFLFESENMPLKGLRKGS